MAFENLEFTDEKMKKVQGLLPSLRASRANIMISGPTGTGKSALAKNLLSLNLYDVLDAADLAEAFDFAGFFQRSRAKDILIENVEKLTSLQQKSLFEVLNRDAGDGKIRVISTTKESLKVLVQKSLFREDLYYRLTVLTLELPALAQRQEDIEILSKHLVSAFAMIHGKEEQDLTGEALEKIKSWSWPGNIRELENVLERAVILSRGSFIDAKEIAMEEASQESSSGLHIAGMTLSEVEQKLILQTLQMTEQNRTRAAEILGISIRTLRNKINEYKQAGVV